MNKLLAIRMVALLLIVGVAATVAALHMIWQQAPIVVLSFHDDAPTWGRAAQAGAAAFVAKSMPAVALLTAVRQIAQKIYVPGKGG